MEWAPRQKLNKEYKAIHCVFPAGCAAVATACVEDIEGLEIQITSL